MRCGKASQKDTIWPEALLEGGGKNSQGWPAVSLRPRDSSFKKSSPPTLVCLCRRLTLTTHTPLIKLIQGVGFHALNYGGGPQKNTIKQVVLDSPPP